MLSCPASSRHRRDRFVNKDGAGIMMRVAHLLSHPIQYKSPLLRRIAREPDIKLTVFFRSDFSVRSYFDEGFGVPVRFDVDLLGGFDHQFLPSFAGRDKISFLFPTNYGLRSRLADNRFDAIWIHGYGTPYNLYAMMLAKSLGLTVLLTDEAHARSRVRGAADELKAKAVFAIVRNCVDRFLTIGSANREYLISRGLSAKKMFLFPYAIDNSWFKPKDAGSRGTAKEKLLAELGAESPRSVVLFASKLIRRKRCADLVGAFARLNLDSVVPRPLLVLVGDGEDRENVLGLIDRHNLKNDVKFLGFRNQSELPLLYQAADVFVLPSDSEPWGLVINEAMIAGCAVISGDEVGSAYDLIKEGENGYVFPAGDIDALSEKLRLSLSTPGWLEAASAASQRRVAAWDFEADIKGFREALGLPPRA